MRLDATTISGYHTGEQGELLQFGKSKDDPTMRQIKVMVGALDPLGLLLVTDVVSGEKADDPLYIPAVDRIVEMVARKGLLLFGDCKMSALKTRAHIQRRGQYYLSPLAMTGHIPEEMAQWVQRAQDNEQLLQSIRTVTEDGEEAVLAQGYTLTRPCTATSADWTGSRLAGRVRGALDALCRGPARGLEKHLRTATTALLGFAPARARQAAVPRRNGLGQGGGRYPPDPACGRTAELWH